MGFLHLIIVKKYLKRLQTHEYETFIWMMVFLESFTPFNGLCDRKAFFPFLSHSCFSWPSTFFFLFQASKLMSCPRPAALSSLYVRTRWRVSLKAGAATGRRTVQMAPTNLQISVSLPMQTFKNIFNSRCCHSLFSNVKFPTAWIGFEGTTAQCSDSLIWSWIGGSQCVLCWITALVTRPCLVWMFRDASALVWTQAGPVLSLKSGVPATLICLLLHPRSVHKRSATRLPSVYVPALMETPPFARGTPRICPVTSIRTIVCQAETLCPCKLWLSLWKSSQGYFQIQSSTKVKLNRIDIFSQKKDWKSFIVVHSL